MADVMDAIGAISSGIDRLLEMSDATDFAALGPDNLIAAMRAFEVQRNRLSGVDHGFVEAATMESLWERTTARNTAGALAQILHLPRSEANARVRAAKWLGARVSLDGQELPPMLPLTSEAQRDGAASASQAAVIGQCIDELACKPELNVDEVRAAEEYLVDHLAAFGPRELQRLAVKIVDTLIPDGTPPRDALVDARRGITIGGQRRDGTSTISGVLTPEVRAQLWAVLSPLSAPRPETNGESDTRSTPQRMHDALGEACARLLSSSDLPSSGGVPATVIVTTTLEQLQTAATFMGDGARWDQATPSFRTVDGTRLSLTQFLRAASQAEIVPTFLDSAGGIVAYGRDRRTASPGQVRALIARDGGCSFPDCDIPPQWCEAHHVVPWLSGGDTDLSNLTLACKYHHRYFESRGWNCAMIDGVPHWTPPSWVDPDRKPVRNLRIHDRHIVLANRAGPPDRTGPPDRSGSPGSDRPEPEPSGDDAVALGPTGDQRVPEASSGTLACASAAQQAPGVRATLPRRPERIERAFDLAYEIELAHAVDDAIGSWVERALNLGLPEVRAWAFSGRAGA